MATALQGEAADVAPVTAWRARVERAARLMYVRSCGSLSAEHRERMVQNYDAGGRNPTREYFYTQAEELLLAAFPEEQGRVR